MPKKVRTAFIDMDDDALAAIKKGLNDPDPEVRLKYVQIWAAYRLGTPKPEPLFDEEPEQAGQVVEMRVLPPPEQEAKVLSVLAAVGRIPPSPGAGGAEPGP